MSDSATFGTAAGLYQDLVVERARRPLHAGDLDPADATADGDNPLCGDRTHVSVRLDDAHRVSTIAHHTRGCAICAASADLMADMVHGLDAPAASALFRQFEALLQDGQDALDDGARGQLGLLLAFAELHDYRSRRKCATLPWSALLSALNSPSKTAEEP